MARRLWTVVMLVGLLLAAQVAGAAPQPAKSAGPVIVRPRFTQLHFRDQVQAVTVVKGHVFVTTYSVKLSEGVGWMLDERTRHLRRLPCSPVVYGVPWTMVVCGNTLTWAKAVLLNLNTGRRVTFGPCYATLAPCGAIAIGRNWIEYNTDRGQRLFQNLWSHQVRPDPTNATTIPNLDSPALAQRLCRPLRTPPVFVAGASGNRWGTVFFDRRFAIAVGSGPDGRSYTTLMRCGSRLRRALSGGVAFAPQAALGYVSDRLLQGFLLPSVRPVSVKLPGLLARPLYFALTARALYLISAQRLWVAPWSGVS